MFCPELIGRGKPGLAASDSSLAASERRAVSPKVKASK
jgi:hypothetical protein